MIDIRSDTVTVPSEGMLRAMMSAEVGDDVYGEDPTVRALEEKAACMFGMEAGLFCPSGTMTNQICVKLHTSQGDEVICELSSHIYKNEGGGIGANSGCSVRVIEGDRGRISPQQVEANINTAGDVHFPLTRLVCLENTCNRAGGSYYTLEQMSELSRLCREKGIAIHLDGARIFNALTVTGDEPEMLGSLFDTISICLSKGLGAPAGSLILASKEMITNARRIRKRMGGGMRQAGYLAAAGIYALENNIPRLAEDHRRAARIAAVLEQLPYVAEVAPVETNIIAFRLKEQTSESFLDSLKSMGIKATPLGPDRVRFVTHLGIDDNDMDAVIKVIREL